MNIVLLLSLISSLSQTSQSLNLPPVPSTRTPILYHIDYSDRFFTEPAYLEQFRNAPPDLLHMGKATPITHLWGPVRLLQGENQYTGGPGHTLSWENIELISPEALAERIERIRRTVQRYHQAGIPQIVPYISYHTLAGDHQKRLGFWKFYDQWDKYARWAGPRPKHDPFDWLVVDRKGQFVEGSCGGFSPAYFAPLHRYRACINHPDWAEWHRRLIRMIAEVGYNGCFVDNTNPDDCYCRYCRDWFRQFLKEQAQQPWVKRFTEGQDTSAWQLDSPAVPAELLRRARLWRTSRYMGELRQVGRTIQPEFVIFPNGNNVHECLTVGLHCDYNMFESTYPPGIMALDEFSVPDRVLLVVSEQINPAPPIQVPYSVVDQAAKIELESQISFPPRVRPGQQVSFQVEIQKVGSSAEDGDWAEGFQIVLEDRRTKEQVRLELTPAEMVGGSSLRPGRPGQQSQPPARMQAQWRPSQPGVYAVGLAFRYTDKSHLATTTDRPYVLWAQAYLEPFCRTHVGTLLYAQHMVARSIFLGYEPHQQGWDHVMELGLAEMAAFSGGGGFAAFGPVQAKYRTFFKRYPELYEGWQMAGPDGLLLAWWGGNPLNYLRPIAQPTLHETLAGSHRPMTVLVDATLPADASWLLAHFPTLWLEAPDYDLTPAQQKALEEYVHQGGWLVLAHDKITWNGRPVVEYFGLSPGQLQRQIGQGRLLLWNLDQPIFRTQPIAPSDGRQAHLRFALYRKKNQLALHVVNYNVCLLDSQKRILEVESTPVELSIPAEWKSANILAYCPDRPEPQSLPGQVAEGKVRFTLPATRIYQVIVLEPKNSSDPGKP